MPTRKNTQTPRQLSEKERLYWQKVDTELKVVNVFVNLTRAIWFVVTVWILWMTFSSMAQMGSSIIFQYLLDVLVGVPYAITQATLPAALVPYTAYVAIGVPVMLMVGYGAFTLFLSYFNSPSQSVQPNLLKKTPPVTKTPSPAVKTKTTKNPLTPLKNMQKQKAKAKPTKLTAAPEKRVLRPRKK